MANPQHVEILLQGAEAWNQWKKGADLSGANLNGANLSGAYLLETIFGNTQLRDVQGLDACKHQGPSILDHRTLAKSGKLPLAFLRGCGLPDKLIEYLPSLLNEAIQFYSCFISYSTKDQEFAERLHAGAMVSLKVLGLFWRRRAWIRDTSNSN